MQQQLLIDAEVYLFRAAAAAEVEVEWDADDWTYICRHGDAQAWFQDAIGELREAMPDHAPVLAFSSGVSFRHGLYPPYKANRKRHRKPAGYRQLLAWAQQAADVRRWGVRILDDVEADDVLGVLQEPGDIIASIDKDMLTLPGLHWRGNGVVEVSQRQADMAFFAQALTGDKADNYPGCPGVGPVKAAQILDGTTCEADMWGATLLAFTARGLTQGAALTQARLARILRPGEYDHGMRAPRLWSPPVS